MANLYLVGFMASGKSTLGQALARETGRKWVDTDREVEKRAGMTVGEIFNRKGAEWFHRAEREVLEDLSRKRSLIVSTGGGLAADDANMELMLSHGTVVWLQASKERTIERIFAQKGTRPLFAGKSPEEVGMIYDELLKEREPYYSRAHVTFDSSLLETPEEIDVTTGNFLSTVKF